MLVSADAATFAKAKTLLRHRSQDPVGPSQRERRAQLRAQRLEQKTAKAYHPQEADNVLEDADTHELEAAASLVDLMAHEALQETGKSMMSEANCRLDGYLHNILGKCKVGLWCSSLWACCLCLQVMMVKP